jgi:hypothetical protein
MWVRGGFFILPNLGTLENDRFKNLITSRGELSEDVFNSLNTTPPRLNIARRFIEVAAIIHRERMEHLRAESPNAKVCPCFEQRHLIFFHAANVVRKC